MTIAQRLMTGVSQKVLLTVLTDISGGTPNINLYSGSTQADKFSNPSSLPGAGVFEVAFNPDRSLMATVSQVTTAAVSIYDVTTNPPTIVATINAPSGKTGQSIDWSPDGRYLAVGWSGSPGFSVYDSSNSYTKLSDAATMPSTSVSGLAFNQAGTRLLVTDDALGTVKMYTLSGTTLTYTSTLTGDGVSPISLRFSDDYSVLVSGNSSASIPFSSWVVTSSGTVYTKNSATASAAAGASRDACIDPTKTYIAVVGVTSPYLTVYNYPAMTKRSNPASLPSTILDGCTFTPDGSELLLAGNAGGLEGYTVSSWTKFTRLSSLPIMWRVKAVLTAHVVTRFAVPGSTTFNSGSGNYTVPVYNTLTVELWGAGASGCGRSGPTAFNAGNNGGASSVSTLSLVAGGGSGGPVYTNTSPGGAAGTASGGNTTNTSGSAGGGDHDGHGGAGANGGAQVNTNTGTVTQAPGNAPGGGGPGSITAGGVQMAGGGGGAYCKSVYTFGAPGAPAVGDLVAYAVGNGGASTGSVTFSGAGGAGRVKFTVA